MAAEMFLTRDEVATLTGAKTRARQIAMLRKNGIRHYLNAAGWPVVSRATVEGSQVPAQDSAPAWKSRAPKAA